jgi:hypothetical protein
VNGLIRMGLGFAGVSDDLAAAIDAEIPGAARLVAACRKAQPDLLLLEPIFEKLMPLVQQAIALEAQVAPLIEQATPIVQRVYPALKAEQGDVTALLPVAEKVLAFVAGKTTG